MTLAPTFYRFRRRSGYALLGIVAFAIFAFGAVDIEAYTAVLVATMGLLTIWAFKKAASAFEIVPTLLYIPPALMALAAACQLVLGTSQAPHATAGALLDWLLYLSFLFVAVNVLVDASIRTWFVRAFLVVVSLAIVVGLAQWLTMREVVYWFRSAPGVHSFGPFANADHFVVLLELAFPVALTMALRERSKTAYYFAFCALVPIALVAAQSKVGLAIIAAQLVFLTILLSVGSFRSALRSRRRGPAFVLGILGSAVLASLLLFASWSMGVLRIGAAELEPAELVLDRSTQPLTQIEVIKTSWNLVQQAPVLGHGFGAFGLVFAQAAPRQDDTEWIHAQCDPLELGVDAGSVGLLAQALLLGLLLFRARNLTVWGLVVTPLAGAWAHSWFAAPIQTPAVMLAGLALLACTPGITERVAVKKPRQPKAHDSDGRVEKPRGYYSSRTKFED